MTTLYSEGDVIAVPMTYEPEFRRSPAEALLQYGSLPQRARMPYFTNVADIKDAMVLPDVVCGRGAERVNTTEPGQPPAHTLIGARDSRALISGLADTFRAPNDGSYWHVHCDLALNTKRHGDRAGIAVGRIGRSWIEREVDPELNRYERVVRTFEVPLAAQIAAPVGEQIYFGSIVRFILQLKQERGFNITSFSTDRFQSADLCQQLMLAGLVTVGLSVDPGSGEIVGVPKPFSVDGRSTQPYRELLEGCAEHRIALPRYPILRRELRELEMWEPGQAPDHPATPTGSKDVADGVAGVVGYLAAFGHTELAPSGAVVDRETLEREHGLAPAQQLGVEDDDDELASVGQPAGFGVE